MTRNHTTRSDPRAARSGLARPVLAWLLAAACSGCQRSDPAGEGWPVANLRFSPSAFDSFRRNAELRYSLKSSSTLSLYVVRRDSAGASVLVKTLVGEIDAGPGTHAITWLGDTDGRSFAPAGLYFGVVRIGGRSFAAPVEVFHF